MRSQIIHIHRNAPPKPAVGAPCNGCGVCCAAELCPAGMLLFRRRHGPCPAMEWHGKHYRCGLLSSPSAYLPRFPARAEGGVVRLFARWIAAGRGCDSEAQPIPHESS
ncbi:MAG: hypothetical protein E6R10_01945 [Rhodocyclaceae bacterium]|nr:MAG: hypothetical protein E6R10_01945 [Rhodocyclaceae bacterium]